MVDEYSRIIEGTSFNNVQIWSETGRRLVVQAGYGEGGTIEVLLGERTVVEQGNGTLSGLANLTPSSSSASIGTFDFNNDGKLDLLTAGNVGSYYDVFLGNGDGTFAARISTLTAGSNVISATAADVTNDGKLDLIGFNFFPGWVEVRPGNGNGTFGAVTTYAHDSGYSSAIATGDLNGDGRVDIVTAGNNVGSALSVLYGNGDGTFQTALTFGGGSPYHKTIRIADFDNDGADDVAATTSGSVSIFTFNSNGTSKSIIPYGTAFSALDLTVDDFTGDGNADLAVSDEGAGVVRLLQGNGDGTFQAATSVAVGTTTFGIASSDVNGDGRKDVVVTDRTSSRLNILLGNGNGTFTASFSYATSANPYDLASGDFNGDGVTDFASASNSAAAINVFLTNTTRTETIRSIEPLTDVNVGTRTTALSTLDAMQGTLATINSVQGVIGAGMVRLETAARVLHVRRDTYEAAASRITDADIAEESSKAVRLSIMQQIGTAAFAQAKLDSRIVLDLLRA